MIREISAGGVVVRRAGDAWEVAVIEPQTDSPNTHGGVLPDSADSTVGRDKSAGKMVRVKKKSAKIVLALPKGLVDPGEKPEQTALREVQEETGLTAVLISKLANIKYVYVRSWGDGERVFKVVSFYLFQYESGEIDRIAPDMRAEVKRACWIALAGAEKKLAYRGEREVVRMAQKHLSAVELPTEDSHGT